MSNIMRTRETDIKVPESVEVKRSDPVYMAHAYLTKVPVSGIVPFIEAFTKPGDFVLDPFAGSGMTGVASMVSGRNAWLFDVSVLGCHIGQNYTRLVDGTQLRKIGAKVASSAQERIGAVYSVQCSKCGKTGRLAKTVWSMIMECSKCSEHVNFYYALEAANWNKANIKCGHCFAPLSTKTRRIAEIPVLDSLACTCSNKLIEQNWSLPLNPPQDDGLVWPDIEISSTRQMYIASALGRHGLTSTATFFSHRNLCALAALKSEIDAVIDKSLREKLRFCFTAILTRASKRYQWSKKRPLNAANANYYIAPVFYEWNVFDLFKRKIEAAIKADNWIRNRCGDRTLFATDEQASIIYEIGSADKLPLPNDCVDYVFTDPPFGSNFFYSDMNLFQEVWLGEITDPALEAVIDRVHTSNYRSADRYEELLTKSLIECKRVLKPGGYITMIFSNSSGKVWQLIQRSIIRAGLVVVPELISILNKGQLSAKGLVSNFENVVTLDLVLTLKERTSLTNTSLKSPPKTEINHFITQSMNSRTTPSIMYLEILRHGFREGWDFSKLSLRSVADSLRELK